MANIPRASMHPTARPSMAGLPAGNPTFVRPKRVSAAVPIIDPASREHQGHAVELRTTNLLLKQKAQAQRDAAQAAEKARAQIDRSGANRTAQVLVSEFGSPYRSDTSPSSQGTGHSSSIATSGTYKTPMHALGPPIPFHMLTPSDGEDEDRELETKGFDVYASPFVPEQLKLVNTLPGRSVAATEPSKNIDYAAYAEATLGRNLLPPVLPLDPHYLFPGTATSQPLTPLSYEYFFRLHIDAEMEAQQRENDTYSLYAHDAVLEFLPDKQARVTIVVPGLRENTPYVEEDDTVELRQLRFDHRGQLLPHGFVQAEPAGPLYTSSPWTETVYLARVAAVNRATEALVLTVAGMTLQSSEVLLGLMPGQLAPAQHRLKFNVQFPLARPRYLHVKEVLPQVQAALLRASQITYQMVPGGGAALAASTNQYWVQSMLFPTEADCEVQANAHSGLRSVTFYERMLNAEQGVAVENVCAQNYGVVPYLISGPPGTGKTKTMIEIALQLVNNVAAVSHILVCAPSEQAADTLADRLREHLRPDELLRLNRPTRPFSEVADAVRPFCYYGKDAFDVPPFERLMSYKVVVSSCRDAQMLMYARTSNTDLYTVESRLRGVIHPTGPRPSRVRLHWDALLIDEAAQATEPESLVPLYVVAPPADAPEVLFTPLLVMAGDEHQLNPRTSSPHTPLQRSLFARLFARPVYADHPLARRFHPDAPGAPSPGPVSLPILRPAFTNLVDNYRSHPAILAVPSYLFYADSLKARAPAQTTARLASWGGWARPRWPVMLHHNVSQDELEADGGGWFNDGEAALACDYALGLARSGLVSEGEICIMSPFKGQVRRVRKLIRGPRYNMWGVNVGPTEAFQGLEHGVVILCVTRSRRRFVPRDVELGWGVIRSRNKMNVALTRAKFGLVILGDRDLLVEEDDAWREVVGFCERNGLVTGPGYAGRSGVPSGEPPKTAIERQLVHGERQLQQAMAAQRWQQARAQAQGHQSPGAGPQQI